MAGDSFACSLPGDADRDGTVAFADFLTLSSGFGQAGNWEQGDFSGDGNVGFEDFLALSANFGESSLVHDSPYRLDGDGNLLKSVQDDNSVMVQRNVREVVVTCDAVYTLTRDGDLFKVTEAPEILDSGVTQMVVSSDKLIVRFNDGRVRLQELDGSGSFLQTGNVVPSEGKARFVADMVVAADNLILRLDDGRVRVNYRQLSAS